MPNLSVTPRRAAAVRRWPMLPLIARRYHHRHCHHWDLIVIIDINVTTPSSLSTSTLRSSLLQCNSHCHSIITQSSSGLLSLVKSIIIAILSIFLIIFETDENFDNVAFDSFCSDPFSKTKSPPMTDSPIGMTIARRSKGHRRIKIIVCQELFRQYLIHHHQFQSGWVQSKLRFPHKEK